MIGYKTAILKPEMQSTVKLYSINCRHIPNPVKLGVWLVVFGVIFPIYGTPAGFLGLPRLTFFRLGLIMFCFCVLAYHVSLVSAIRMRAVALLCLLFLLRLMSLPLTATENLHAGATQLWWYFQGLLCLIIILAFVRRWPYLRRYLYSKILFFGTIAALLTSYQFIILVKFGKKFSLPFSMTKYGIEAGNLYSGWYPLGPGWRAMGPFFDPNMTGTFILLYICLLLPFLLYGPKKRSIKVLVFLGIAIGLIAMVGSGSRLAVALLVLVSYVYLLMALSKKHWSMRPVYRGLITIIILLSGFLAYSYFATTMIFDISNRMRGQVFDRFAESIQTGDFGGARVSSSMSMISSLNINTLFLGAGEGSGWWSSHNAYLIVLYENGLSAAIVLISVSCLMLIKTYKNANRHIKLNNYDPVAIAGPLIVISWILMIGMNWAQLNQSFPWIFLALILMPSRWVSMQNSNR